MRKLALIPVAVVAMFLSTACGAESDAGKSCVTVNPGQVTTVGDVKIQVQADQTQKSGKRTVTGAILTLTSQTSSKVDVTIYVSDNYQNGKPNEYDVHWGSTTITPGKDNALTISAAPYGYRDVTTITSAKVCLS